MTRFISGSGGRVSHTGLRLFFAAMLLLLSGCDVQRLWSPPAVSTPAPSPTATAATTTLPTAPSPTATLAGSSSALTIWVPPQFDPESGTPAGKLLKARLDLFVTQNPGTQIIVRVKAPTGPAGLLESMASASAAAPAALPSLIALPRTDLETAALKGLVFPLDGLSNSIDETDWYEYARQMALIQGSTFGLPFAGDALVLAYRPARVNASVNTWNHLLSQSTPLAFPGGDPQSLLTVALYLSAGGAIENPQGHPTLDPAVLSRVLELVAAGSSQGVFPDWLLSIHTDDQAWQAYRDSRAQWLVTWSSRYFNELPADTLAVPLFPMENGQEVTLATGWVWAVSDPVEARRANAVRLAEFLVQSDFLSAWSAAAGYLPPRPSALSGWSNATQQNLISQVSLAARVRPTNDLLTSLSSVLDDAFQKVMNHKADPNQAAEDAARRLMSTQNK